MVQLNQNFIDTITQELPAHLSMDEFIAACDRPLRRSIPGQYLKISSDDFKTLMQPKGWTFDPIPWCEDGFWISYDEEEQLGNALEHIQGLFYIQEASSMLPPTALLRLVHLRLVQSGSAYSISPLRRVQNHANSRIDAKPRFIGGE